MRLHAWSNLHSKQRTWGSRHGIKGLAPLQASAFGGFAAGRCDVSAGPLEMQEPLCR